MADNSGHDNKGRFTSGNPGGRGRHKDRLQKALEESVTAEDIQEIVEALKDRAKDGDIKAAELLFNRLLGKPAQNKAEETPGAQDMAFVTFDDDDMPPDEQADALDGIQWDMEALTEQLQQNARKQGQAAQC